MALAAYEAPRGRIGIAMKTISIEYQEPEPLDVPEPLVVHYLPGTGSRLVVSLAGVGGGPGRKRVPPIEFIGTASGYGENHVLFVSDITRSWMNAPGLASTLVALIEKMRAEHGLTEVVALGNSMGGFAALRLPELTEIHVVASFAPQFSMHPDLVPEETRWAQHSTHIRDWRYPDVGALAQKDTAYFIFHGSNPNEARHWLRFPWRPKINHFIFTGLGHDLAARLQKRRLLGQVFNAA